MINSAEGGSADPRDLTAPLADVRPALLRPPGEVEHAYTDAAGAAAVLAVQRWVETNRRTLERIAPADRDALLVRAAVAYVIGTRAVEPVLPNDTLGDSLEMPDPYAHDLQRALRAAMERRYPPNGPLELLTRD
ncbi:hypothetical protein [Dactylosporangium sp. CS-033363]|uniref:hypothetical protein n=1 Tax=Dactylosporangium sp. CS-033363 TaxID=3239935 RepID=UPI003D8B1D44